ncbi:MAG: Hpt domain-containing protein, partial [Pseudomonadales bacterium]
MTQTLLQSQPNSLNWAVDELNNELNLVLRILENYSENPQGEGSLDECLQHLKQVTGIFAVTNMAIPQLLGEELQTAISDYSTQTGKAATDTISLVAEAILELSSYLGNPKRIKRLIPQINNLRALTERELFTESSAVEINLSKGFRAFRKPSPTPLDSQTIRKLRMLYQKTVLSLFKSGLSKETLGSLQKVFKILYQMGGTPYLSALGYSGLTLIERLQSNRLTLNIAVKSLFKRLDDVLKKLNAGTDYEDPGLLKNILYYVACGSDHGKLSAKLIQIFSLQEFADDSGTATQGNSLSMEPELVARVIEVLQTEIEQAKTWLDDCLHQVCKFDESVKQVKAILRRADDTLVMVGADAPRKSAQKLLEILEEWAKLDSEKDLSIEDLDRFANEMVNLESQLGRLSHPSTNGSDESAGVSGAKATILDESRVALTQIKTSINQFIESNWQWAMLREVPSSLAMVEGALRFYPLDDLAKVVNCIRRYVSESLLERREEPNQQEIELFADVIVAVDYYLESLERGTAFNLDFLIEKAIDNCSTLGFSYPEVSEKEPEKTEEPTEPGTRTTDQSPGFTDTSQINKEGPAQSPAPTQGERPSTENKESANVDIPEPEATANEPAVQESGESEDDNDFEIIEIFVEEAGEILPVALEQLKEWRENGDKAALLDLRRGFHTLKGGGRMIGASVLGELSWALENLLNRIIDGSVEITQEIYELTQEALHQYPALLEELASSGQETSNENIERIQTRAHVLSDPLANTSSAPEEREESIDSDSEAPEPSLENEPQEATGAEVISDGLSASTNIEPDPEIDEVVTTFVSEAESHRKSIIQLIAAASSNKNEDLSGQLVTILHTLSDSARVAELDDLADSIIPMQKMLQLYNSFNAGLSSEFIALLSIWAGKFDNLLNNLAPSGNLDLKAIQDFTRSASELYQREEKALSGDLSSDRKKRFLPLHKLMAEKLDHLIIAEQLIEEWQQGKISSEELDGLDADIKLLQEVATSCKVDEIVKLCQLIETVQFGLTGLDSLEASQAEWLDEAYGLLLKMLDAVASWQVVPKISDDLVANLPQFQVETGEKDTAPKDAADNVESEGESPSIELEPESPVADDLQFDSNFIDPEDEFQQELLDTFLEEADDLMQEIGTSISDWRRDPTAFNNADLIHRALHTLKGGARLSGLTKLGDYSHDFESFILDQQVLQKTDEKFFSKALDRLDHLNSHIEAIREAMLTGGSVEDIPEPGAAQQESGPEVESVEPAKTETPGNEVPLQVITAEELAPSESDLPASNTEKIIYQNKEATAENETDTDSRAFETRQQRQENIRLRSDMVDEMVNLSSEATVYRGRVEAQLSGFEANLDELEATIGRIQQLARRLDTETEAQIQFRSEQLAESGEEEDFDPLEMDRYSTLQQLSHQLIESASDLQDLRISLSETNRDTNVLLIQSGRIQSELNAKLMRTRMVPFERILPRLERNIRTVSRELNQTAELRSL